MASLGEIRAELTADSSGFTKGVGSAIDSMTDLSGLLGSTKGKIAALGAVAAAAAAGGLAAATTQAAEFERTIAGAAARAGATQEAFDQFGAAAKQASLDSAFGANEAGGALRFLAKSGFEVQEATEALPGILRGATAAGMDAAEMGEIASNALRQFNRSADETEEVMDVLVKASTSANTSVQELGSGLSVVGGLAAEAGMSIEETSALFASLQDAGIGASRAATAMRAGISKLLKPSSEANATLQKLGVNVKDSSGEFRGMIDVIADLEKAGASAEDMLAIFGRRAGPTLQTALSQGGASLHSFKSELENADGTSREIASFIRSSLSEQVKVLMGSLETLAANVGTLVVPALKGLVTIAQGLTVALNAVVDAGKSVAQFLAGGFATSAEEAGFAVDETGDQVDDTTDSLEEHRRAAREAAKENVNLKNKTSELREEIAELEKQIDDETRSILDRAMAQGELNEKQKELRQELAKQRGKAKPELLDQIRTSMAQIEEAEQSLSEIDSILGSIAGSFGVDVLESDAPALELARAGAPQSVIDRAQRLLNLREEQQENLRKERGVLREAQREYERTVDLQHETNQLGEDRKKQIDEQFEGLKRQTREMQRQTEELSDHEKFLNAFDQSEAGRQQALEEAKARSVGMSTGGRLGDPMGPTDTAMALPDAPRRGVAETAEDSGHGKFTELIDTGASAEEIEEAQKAREQELQAAQQLTGEVTSMTNALMEAAGASDEAASAISGIGGAAQSVMGGIAAGGPAGIAAGIFGGVTSLIQGFAQGGTTSQADTRRERRRDFDYLAERMGEEMERRNLRPVEIRVAGRARGTRRRQRSDRGQLRDLEEQEKLKGVGLGG